MIGKWRGKKVGVIMGGTTPEREISLRTGRAISMALKHLEYDVVDIDAASDLVDTLKATKIDVAFIALHGKLGEDGCIQGLLEWLRIPYTGSGVTASAVAMHKVLCKSVARELCIPVAEDHVFVAGRDDPLQCAARLSFPYPVIVKPSREGSTINVTIVRDAEELLPALDAAEASDAVILIERFIQGTEVTVGILEGKALPVLEIAPKQGFYDYTAKYTKGMTNYILPARIPDATARRVLTATEKLYAALECSGVARADFMISSEGKECFLEINTIPGMTETSLVPKAAAHIGMEFNELCERILEGAHWKVDV